MFWKYVSGGGGMNACLGGLQVKHTLIQDRCNQINACPGCTLKPVPGGVDKTDTCSGVILHIVLGGEGGGGGGGGCVGVVCKGIAKHAHIAGVEHTLPFTLPLGAVPYPIILWGQNSARYAV